MRQITRNLLVWLWLAWFLGVSGLSASALKPADIVNWKLLKSYSIPQLQEMLENKQFKAEVSPQVSKMLGKPQNAVKIYLVEYLTRNYDGKLVKVSGALLVPQNAQSPYPLLSYQHGTIIEKIAAPSYPEKCLETQVIMALFAAHGYVVSMPDYIGLGRSGLMHPYFHTPTEVSTSLDMLIAANALCGKLGVKLNSRLFLSGYSQGGQVTAAFQQLLEKGYRWRFPITASAPGAAPCDLPALWAHLAKRPIALSNPVMSYLVVAYQQIYGPYSPYKAIFQEKYAEKIPHLMSGMVTQVKQNPFPQTPGQLFQAEFLASVQKGHPFYRDLQKNSIKPWVAITPTCFYYSLGDEAVPARMVEQMYQKCLKTGGDFRIKNCGVKLTHIQAFIPLMVNIRNWFDQLK